VYGVCSVVNIFGDTPPPRLGVRPMNGWRRFYDRVNKRPFFMQSICRVVLGQVGIWNDVSKRISYTTCTIMITMMTIIIIIIIIKIVIITIPLVWFVWPRDEPTWLWQRLRPVHVATSRVTSYLKKKKNTADPLWTPNRFSFRTTPVHRLHFVFYTHTHTRTRTHTRARQQNVN
jgi:hypothetical protein